MPYDFTDRMAAGKERAAINRNKGRHVGAQAKGWNVKRAPMQDDFQSWALVIQREWQADARTIVNDFRADCLNGRERSADDDIPF